MPVSKVFDPITWHFRYHDFFKIETTLMYTVSPKNISIIVAQLKKILNLGVAASLAELAGAVCAIKYRHPWKARGLI